MIFDFFYLWIFELGVLIFATKFLLKLLKWFLTKIVENLYVTEIIVIWSTDVINVCLIWIK